MGLWCSGGAASLLSIRACMEDPQHHSLYGYGRGLALPGCLRRPLGNGVALRSRDCQEIRPVIPPLVLKPDIATIDVTLGGVPLDPRDSDKAAISGRQSGGQAIP